MSAQLLGASQEEIRHRARVVAGRASRISEELSYEEPNFESVKVDLWRLRRAVDALEDGLKWRLIVDDSGERAD